MQRSSIGLTDESVNQAGVSTRIPDDFSRIANAICSTKRAGAAKGSQISQAAAVPFADKRVFVACWKVGTPHNLACLVHRVRVTLNAAKCSQVMERTAMWRTHKRVKNAISLHERITGDLPPLVHTQTKTSDASQ